MSFTFLPNTAVAASVASKDKIYTYAQTYHRELVEIEGGLAGSAETYDVAGNWTVISITSATGHAPAKRFTPLAAVNFDQQKRYVFYVDDENYLCDIYASANGTWSQGKLRQKAWKCAAYSKLAAIKVTNREGEHFVCVYFQDTAETGDIKVVHHGRSFGWEKGPAPIDDPPLYGTSLSVVPAQPGIEVKPQDDDTARIRPPVFFQYDNLNLGSSQDEGADDYATYVITDNHAALSAHASIAAVDDGNSFWCFSTTDSNQVYRLRVDKQGVVAQPQLVPLDVTPVPSSPLAAVLVKDAAAKERIVIFYLLHYDNVKRTTHETNVFATTLTATTSPAADTWSLSGQVCLAPSYYAITGIKTGVTTTTVPLRLEADAWYLSSTTEHRLQRSLFLHALRRLQKRDPSKKLSFFQIGGIHGMPYKPWDEDTKPATPNEGYCTHDSLLFPCWHRPYMMLFEQVLHEIMIKELIPQLPKDERKDWTDAANTWRLPYWDWAEKKTRAGNDDPIYDVPLITQDPRIAVINLKDPKGADSEYYVDNPMYKFTMPHKKAMGEYGVHDIKEGKVDIPFSKSKGTSRSDTFPTSPISQEWLETWIIGKVNNTVVATSLKDHSWYGKNMKDTDKVPIAEMVYRLYDPNYISTFTQFATTKFHSKDAPATWLNLEYIHNNIHNWTGGFDKYIGHMTEVPVAGFDPIFYMHHANVDRQFAIWQAINQKNTDSNWFQKPSEQLPDDGTWSIKAGATDTPVTPLAPFHKDTEGNYFTSNDIRNWLDWGYSYPELQPWLDKYKKDGKFDVDLYIDDIKKQLKTLYSPHEDDDDDDENTETDETDTETSQALAARMLVRSPGGGAPARRQRKKWSKDIIVNITYDRFAFGGAPYILHLFIGDKSVLDGYTDRLEEHQQHVGLVCTFTSAAPAGGEADSEGDGCGACKKKSAEGTKSRAQVPITGAMMARIPPRGSNHGELEISHGIYPFPAQELEKPRVEDYLEEYLHWRVRSLDGTDIPASDFIKVAVYHRDARFDVDYAANPAQYSLLQRATNTKAGGDGFPSHI